MGNALIKKLTERYTLHTSPDVATTVEQGLVQLSSGIYTEEERFIFELLQNAVDSFDENSNEVLNISLRIEKDYLVFMHNGEAFSARDIEGLCDIGNGNKTKDTKKIGYKGIGFKSVFMRSTCVTVKSGEYCFKFDKHHWERYWENNWRKEYGEKDQEKVYLMPWQIIPIETSEPISIDTSLYNVVTYIQTVNTTSLESKIVKLLSNSQFLLFLRCRNIQMTFATHDKILANVSKICSDNLVVLSSNGNEDSRWLTYINPEVVVPKELYNDIKADINTPQKLKDSKTFDLSFAIRIDAQGKIEKLSKEESVIYTYLPTSYRFADEGFPFLVNANFITDAGRQQLHKDSEWNKLIFSKIPHEYLTWIKQISSNYSNYYEVLPKISYGSNNELENVFAAEMEEAIRQIAFIPRESNTKSKVLASAAVMDKMGISEAISREMLVAHINRTHHKNYFPKDFIAPIWKGSKLLEDYGVFVFDKQKLKDLFEDNDAFADISAELDVKLIDFLFNYYLRNRNEQEEFISVLQNTRFILDENGNLSTPDNLFFPSQYKECNSLAEDAIFLHSTISEHLKENKQEFDWIAKLGVEELSDITFIKNVICKSGYVTEENSIEVTRFLFDTNSKQNIFEEIDGYVLSCLNFLTKKGTLKSASDLYLSSKYKPEIDIEPCFDGDIFVSDDYCESPEHISEWRLFLTKLGINDTISLKEITIDRKECDLYDILKRAKQKFNQIKQTSTNGNPFRCYLTHFKIQYNPFALSSESVSLLQIVWSEILSKERPKGKDLAYGECDMYYVIHLEIDPINELVESDFIQWAFAEFQKFPATDGLLYRANKLLINSEDIQYIADKYLPVINLDKPIHESWNEVLHLRNILQFDDYLTILSNISEDEANAEQNKERISKIYQRLIDLDCLTSSSKVAQIQEWSKTNKILSKDGTFMYPKDLSHITLDGFKTENRVYIGSPSDRGKVIELLSLMGVKVITESNIKPSFAEKTESKELQKLLIGKLSPLAIISINEDLNVESYREKKKNLHELLSNTHFYHCESIHLTYGNDNDIIEKNTFGNKNEFYYTGSLRPANVEPLLSPLCKYLGINGKERELFILLIENVEGIRQNLEDKGYDMSLLEEELYKDSGTLQVTLGGYNPGVSDRERNARTGFKGEILIYEKLLSMGYHPVCPSISTEDDYEQVITIKGKDYYCKTNYDKYDITFETKSGITVYLEVKATTRDKSSQENMPISYRELSMIEECDANEKCSYMIVRVFGIDKDMQDIYLFKGKIVH